MKSHAIIIQLLLFMYLSHKGKLKNTILKNLTDILVGSCKKYALNNKSDTISILISLHEVY